MGLPGTLAVLFCFGGGGEGGSFLFLLFTKHTFKVKKHDPGECRGYTEIVTVTSVLRIEAETCLLINHLVIFF